MKKILSLIILILCNSSVHTMETTSARVAWSSLSEYLEDMKTQGKQAVMIVGCGHGPHNLEGDHHHLDAWCVDVNSPAPFMPSYSAEKDSSAEDKEPYWKKTGANAELDITSLASYSGYRHTFNVVVLERNWQKTLNHPRTLFNAATFLKPGGQLVVDIHHTYDLSYKDQIADIFPNISMGQELEELVNLNNFFLIYFYDHSNKEFQEEYKKDYKGNNVNIERMVEKYKTYNQKYQDSNSKAPGVPKLWDMAQYLVNWFFTDPILMKDSELSFNKRRSDYLVITKTKESADNEGNWKKAVEDYIKKAKK